MQRDTTDTIKSILTKYQQNVDKNAWVRDITHIDLLTYYLGLGLKASGENFVREVGSAQPQSAQPTCSSPLTK